MFDYLILYFTFYQLNFFATIAGTFSNEIPPAQPILADKEFFLLFLIFDENLSHYYEENLQIFLQSDPESFEVTDDFKESNRKKGWSLFSSIYCLSKNRDGEPVTRKRFQCSSSAVGKKHINSFTQNSAFSLH